MLAFAFSETSTFCVGLTTFDAKLPTASKPFDSTLPVNAKPKPMPFDAPTTTSLAVIFFLLTYNYSISWFIYYIFYMLLAFFSLAFYGFALGFYYDFEFDC